MKTRRDFLKGILAIGAAAAVPLSATKKYLTYSDEDWYRHAPTDIHVDKQLTEISLRYSSEPFIANPVFPTVQLAEKMARRAEEEFVKGYYGTTTANNPLDDIKLGIKKIEGATGVVPKYHYSERIQYDILVQANSLGYFFTNCVD